MSVCRRVGAVCSTDWWAFSGSRCTVVWRATRIPTTLNGFPKANDPTMRVVVGRRGGPERPARQHQHHEPVRNRGAYGPTWKGWAANAKWVDGSMCTPHRRVILDMDSSESPVHGEQEGASSTVTLGARAITLCSCSTSSVTARARCSVRGTYIARTGGVMYWIRSCLATGRQECGGTFVPMPHSLSRTSMNTWRRGTSFTL